MTTQPNFDDFKQIGETQKLTEPSLEKLQDWMAQLQVLLGDMDLTLHEEARFVDQKIRFCEQHLIAAYECLVDAKEIFKLRH